MMTNQMKKTMTKKVLKEFYQFYQMGRSSVGFGQNLGTHDMKNPKLYNRNKAKEHVRSMLQYD